MALEKKWNAVPPQSFTANGNQSGLVAVADTAGFKTKQSAYIKSSALPNLAVQVKRVISPTMLFVGRIDGNISTWKPLDISGYLVADGASIGAEEQDKAARPPPDDHYAAIYESDPIVADRVIFVDKYGQFYDDGNPLPIAFDGTISVGTVTVTNFPNPVDTNYGVVGPSTIRTAAQIGNATGAANFNAGITGPQTLRASVNITRNGNELDYNFGISSANTLRTSSLIGNATGAADFNAGVTGPQTLRVASNLYDFTGNGITSTSTGGKQALDVNIAGGSFTIDTGVIDESTFTYGVSVEQPIGGVFQDTSPGLTAGQTGAVRLTQNRAFHTNLRTSGGSELDYNFGAASASTLRVASLIGNSTGAADFNFGTVGAQTIRTAAQIGNATGTADFNFGTIGAQSIRTAAQIGNATGAALFGAGTTTAQVLRVVLPTDQTAIPVTQSGAWSVNSSNFPTTIDTNYGTVGASTIRTAAQIGNATGSALFGAGTTTAQVLRVVLPTDQTAIPVTQSGTWSVGVTNLPTTVDTNYGTVGASTIRTAAQIGNATGSANFNYGTIGAQSLRTAAQIGNATGAADFNYGTVGAQTIRTAAQIGNATGAADFNAGATGAQTLRTQANQGAPNTAANAWPTKITDGTDTAKVTTNSDLSVSDGLRNGGVYGNLNLPTGGAAVEAKVGVSRLVNRKSLTITALDNMFWGYDSSVTTSTGTPLNNNQQIVFAIDPDSTFQVWVVAAANNKNARITEST